MTDKFAVLEDLRSRIPEFECTPGCTACCANVAWSEFEYNLLTPSEQATLAAFTLKCPFSSGGGCAVHEKRPISCRIFGVTEGVACPRGQIATKGMLSVADVTEIMKVYQKTFFKEE